MNNDETLRYDKNVFGISIFTNYSNFENPWKVDILNIIISVCRSKDEQLPLQKFREYDSVPGHSSGSTYF